MEADNLIAVTHRFAYLTKEFERIAKELSEHTLNSSATLDRSIAQTSQAIKKLLEESGALIQTQARQAITNATEISMRELEARIQKLCETFDEHARHLEETASRTAKQSKRMGWITLAGAWLVSLSVLGLSVWLTGR